MPNKEENLFLTDHSYGPIKKQHDPVYQLKIQQGEIREKGGIGIQLKKRQLDWRKLWDTNHEQAHRKKTCFSRSP